MRTVTFPATQESRQLARDYDYSEWVVNRFAHYVPDLQRFLKTMERPPPQYIRVNTLKTSKAELQERLAARGFVLRGTALEDVLEIAKAPHPAGATPEYLMGHYYIQDLSSCVAVVALDPRPEEVNLDMCAAPGGKTTYIAQLMKNTGLLVALEAKKQRMRSLVFNAGRCGVMNACIYNLDALDAQSLGLTYDRVMLDAPCTCEGVIPKDLERKKSRKPEDVEFCSGLQTKLVERAAGLLKDGGCLVYATCSFAPEENELIVDHIVRKYDAKVIPIQFGGEGLRGFGDLEFDPQVRNSRRFYPHLHSTLGFYIARIMIG